MNYTNEQIAAALDLAVLSPTATREQVTDACTLANQYNVASVCVAGCNVAFAKSLFPRISTVVGFPHGDSTGPVKYLEARAAIVNGASEIDFVVNYGRFLDGDPQPLIAELALLTTLAGGCGVKLKAILECSEYSTAQLIDAIEICCAYGVDFIKTSTGVNGIADAVDVKTILNHVQRTQLNPGTTQVKASGGIYNYERAKLFLDLGCTRLGSSKCVELMP